MENAKVKNMDCDASEPMKAIREVVDNFANRFILFQKEALDCYLDDED